ncbi:sodium/potassium-transporting ATPase subunit gamma [Esox lucius]|uniref:sodium/potassium-transporting ATPase subunit gamma n=1 Tax=Esox lucius TaxID=8010 RepID=UPI000576BD35|nr:sodium/potassium-transporting ATPase subunit gamma [Esox lucius]
MSAAEGPKYDPDADFHYDYQTLRIGGLAFAGFLVILSVILLTGHRLFRCGRSKAVKRKGPHKLVPDSEEQKDDEED